MFGILRLLYGGGHLQGMPSRKTEVLVRHNPQPRLPAIFDLLYYIFCRQIYSCFLEPSRSFEMLCCISSHAIIFNKKTPANLLVKREFDGITIVLCPMRLQTQPFVLTTLRLLFVFLACSKHINYYSNYDPN